MVCGWRWVVKTVAVLVAAGLGTAVAQEPTMSDLARMVKDLQKMVEQNTQEIVKLKQSSAEKDKALAEKDQEINKLKETTADLSGKVVKVDAVEKEVRDYIKEAATKEGPVRENEFGVLVGGMSGPYGTNDGAFFGGFVDMAWVPKDPFGNKISGELLAMFGQTDKRRYVTPALDVFEPGMHTQEIDTMAVIVGPKYTVVNKHLGPIRPYFVTGLGMYVYGQEMSNRFVMGQVPAAGGLAEHHSPAGNADLQFGVNIGGGVEWRINDYLGIGWDMRRNIVTGKDTDFTTTGGYISLNY